MALLRLALLVLSVCMLLVALLLKLPARPALRLEQLPRHLRAWFGRGSLHEVMPGRHMFAICEGPENATDTVVLIHGFPSSSWDYHRALPLLRQAAPQLRLLLFDHVGFGFSDKPAANVTYSIGQHVDHALLLWRRLRLQHRVHFVAHDMGDSVLTELLARAHLGLLPEQFSKTGFPASVTFTNGGMLVSFAPAASPMARRSCTFVRPGGADRFSAESTPAHVVHVWQSHERFERSRTPSFAASFSNAAVGLHMGKSCSPGAVSGGLSRLAHVDCPVGR